MAKRTRGSARPGQRRPARGTRPARPNELSGAARPNEAAATRPGSLTDTEAQRAAELEAEIVARERAAEADRQRAGRRASQGLDVRPRDRGAAMIGARASEEYAYVVRDVRRIVTIGGSLLLVMLVLFVAIEVLHLVTI
jgi:hypothetical protein